MAEFDTISKYLMQTYPDQFARFSLGREDVDVLEVLNPEQPTVEARYTDSLLRVRLDDEEVLIHNEFQTTDSTHLPMPRRMAGYIGRAIEHYGMPVYSSVLYLRPDAGQRDPGQYLQVHPDHQVVVQYKAIRLSELDGQRILDAGYDGVRAVDEAACGDGCGRVAASVCSHGSCAVDGGSVYSGQSSRWHGASEWVGVCA